MKKKLIAMLLTGVMLGLVLTGCGGNDTNQSSAVTSTSAATEKNDLVVFAAASMTETLTELSNAYMKEHPEVNVVLNFDSSGTLKAQIQEGADCDVFISAGQLQMDQLDATADKTVNTEDLDFVLEDSRFNILENKVALAVPDANEKGINSYEDLKTALKNEDVLLAMGNSDVPVGQYTQKILTYLGLDEAALASAGKITYGSNVKEVTTQVSEGAVDCGIIYQTDAYSAGLKVVDTATPEMCGQVIYPACVIKTTKQPDVAKDFLAFLTTDEADAVFEKVGFTAIND